MPFGLLVTHYGLAGRFLVLIVPFPVSAYFYFFHFSFECRTCFFFIVLVPDHCMYCNIFHDVSHQFGNNWRRFSVLVHLLIKRTYKAFV